MYADGLRPYNCVLHKHEGDVTPEDYPITSPTKTLQAFLYFRKKSSAKFLIR